MGIAKLVVKLGLVVKVTVLRSKQERVQQRGTDRGCYFTSLALRAFARTDFYTSTPAGRGGTDGSLLFHLRMKGVLKGFCYSSPGMSLLSVTDWYPVQHEPQRIPHSLL